MRTPINRRDFIMKSSLPVAAALISPPKFGAFGPGLFHSEKDKIKCRMRVGSDTDKLPSAVKNKGAFAVLDYLKERGFDGAFFRLMLELSPTLDPGELKEVKAYADSLGMFLEAGIGWINPYNTPERPEIRRFGKGDYRKAVEKMISAAGLINCKELWAVSAHSIHGDPFYVAYDRFRTDVTWDDQIEAMIKFMSMLAPLLRDTGCRLNLETHGDETSFEAIRMIERLGPDIIGVTLDTGNLPLQADLPSSSIKRLAPYVHMTHCKDGIIYRSAEGLNQQIRSLGEGIIDWKAAIEILARHQPDLNLNIEEYRAENLLLWSTPEYSKYYPDLSKEDIAEFNRLADETDNRIKKGEIIEIKEYHNFPFSEQERDKSYIKGAGYLRGIIQSIVI